MIYLSRYFVLDLKKTRGLLLNEINEKNVQLSEDGSSTVAGNRRQKSVEECIEFLESIGVSGVGDFSLYDPVKVGRQIRADQMSQTLNQKYVLLFLYALLLYYL